jgi:hypothetical protein
MVLRSQAGKRKADELWGRTIQQRTVEPFTYVRFAWMVGAPQKLALEDAGYEVKALRSVQLRRGTDIIISAAHIRIVETPGLNVVGSQHQLPEPSRFGIPPTAECSDKVFLSDCRVQGVADKFRPREPKPIIVRGITSFLSVVESGCGFGLMPGPRHVRVHRCSMIHLAMPIIVGGQRRQEA